ncbi:4a-hydroxytetrahydrobiopterin dehydratase [Sedimenticola thiotaurini]|uniref:Putative pterin-4-alpha-carbinolamine dehydratase n=1 Tax=Sedimenticola thiotaurini TaxID=1543721 RepID=A0A0F7JVK3_9GAMM|nr:4a-hydroxytetrahydrobiopterin dehydratase [Sedimenticola thiotaurini]AKH19587.1 pterin-4-alpha-carbinolamine dehydratase [Sedimenticola thiotaurini]
MSKVDPQATPLLTRHCEACNPQTPPLPEAECRNLLAKLAPEWSLVGSAQWIKREFRFKDFYQTMAFVNAVAWIANVEDHHPELEVSYNRCLVSYTTHAIGHLSENDFICAAKIDALIPDES